MVDEANALVLVGDSENLEIHAFDFEGNLVHSIDSPLVVTAGSQHALTTVGGARHSRRAHRWAGVDTRMFGWPVATCGL